MSESYYFVSDAGVFLPVQSVTEEPDEDMLIAAHISTVDITSENRQPEPQHRQQTNYPSTSVASTTTVEQKMDTEEQKVESKKDENASEEKKEKPASVVEMCDAKVVQEDENCIEENAYVAFGPGGDPGRDKALGPLMDEEEELPHKVWFRDDCYDSEDSYFDEDYFDDFDDCF